MYSIDDIKIQILTVTKNYIEMIDFQQINASSAPILQQVLSTSQTEHIHMTPNRTNIRQSQNSIIVSSSPSIVTSSSSGTGGVTTQSSLIKAILANKVTTVGTPNITTNLVPSINPIITATSNMNVHQVTF